MSLSDIKEQARCIYNANVKWRNGFTMRQAIELAIEWLEDYE